MCLLVVYKLFLLFVSVRCYFFFLFIIRFCSCVYRFRCCLFFSYFIVCTSTTYWNNNNQLVYLIYIGPFATTEQQNTAEIHTEKKHHNMSRAKKEWWLYTTRYWLCISFYPLDFVRLNRNAYRCWHIGDRERHCVRSVPCLDMCAAFLYVLVYEFIHFGVCALCYAVCCAVKCRSEPTRTWMGDSQQCRSVSFIRQFTVESSCVIHKTHIYSSRFGPLRVSFRSVRWIHRSAYVPHTVQHSNWYSFW